MAPVYVLDKYYLSITFLVTIAYQLLGFAIAWTLQFDKITDFTGGSNFWILALLTLVLGNSFHSRNIISSVLVMVWATRLAGFLLFRVLKMGSDTRFDEMRSKFFLFLAFWIGQMVWVWTVSLPLIILNSPAISNIAAGGASPPFGTALDIAGVILWVIGWLTESVGDFQKYRYKSSKSPKGVPMKKGVWAWSRHPPYFGEIMCWWGIWMLCLSPSVSPSSTGLGRRAQLGSIVSPLFTMFLLMFASGIPTAEKPQARKFYLLSNGPCSASEYHDAWKNYQEYLSCTSVLIPIPPTIYRPLPVFIKRWVLFDFPMYQFIEKSDGPTAIAEEQKKMEGQQ